MKNFKLTIYNKNWIKLIINKSFNNQFGRLFKCNKLNSSEGDWDIRVLCKPFIEFCSRSNYTNEKFEKYNTVTWLEYSLLWERLIFNMSILFYIIK